MNIPLDSNVLIDLIIGKVKLDPMPKVLYKPSRLFRSFIWVTIR